MTLSLERVGCSISISVVPSCPAQRKFSGGWKLQALVCLGSMDRNMAEPGSHWGPGLLPAWRDKTLCTSFFLGHLQARQPGGQVKKGPSQGIPGMDPA
jgi:hypothetical protein